MSPRPELLSPVGGPEHLRAAVENGADAVYLGCGAFNARRRAKNFTPDELTEAVAYCRLRGARVYLTLNTLVAQRELPDALETARLASAAGVDAVLVQDLGLARLLRAALPDLPLHASTQMTVHSLDGVKLCADLGLTRVVLSRELCRDAIAHICAHSPVEIEVFVHGALCMCYSGQCHLSALIGTRSGNRGLCAQPCRLPYSGGAPLSLKDMSLAGHLRELSDMGVACLKIEGRMKRPEYVAIVTRVYAAALREGRAPTPEELRTLEAAFSRSGFTDGYYRDRTGPHMFGVRGEAPREDEALFAQARRSYEKPQPLVPVDLSVTLRPGAPAAARATDGPHTAAARGPVPEAARTRPLTQEEVAQQLSKTGGTPYYVNQLQVDLAPGLSVPRAALNALRRELLDGLTAQRTQLPCRREGQVPPLTASAGPKDPPELVFTLRTAQQLTPALWRLPHRRIDLPVEEFFRAPEAVAAARGEGAVLSAALPRIAWDRERPALLERLEALRALGVDHALVPTWDLLPPARALGFALHGDAGLGVYNGRTLAALAELGFASATVSFELRLAAVRDLPKPLPLEAIVYGRLPLMVLQQFPGGRPTDCLTDRKGVAFPVLPAPGGRAELFNSQTLYLADKPDYRSCGLTAARLLFTTESPARCAQTAAEYLSGAAEPPGSFTRGLYYRDVE